MDAIIMPLITSLVAKLQNDFHDIHFRAGDYFYWSPLERTIVYDSTSTDLPSLLHEVSHALLGHIHYHKDTQLLELERQAWEYAQKVLSGRYQVDITEEQIESPLDSYRDWLHARSLCPHCHATGFQTKQQEYTCPACRTHWHVNNARSCALRRKIVK